MQVERIVVQACCGKKVIVFKTKQPITLNLLAALVAQGFTEQPHFTKAGILYVDNLDFFVSGPIGSDRLQVTCKVQEGCEQKINDLEGLLLQLE